MHLQGLFQEPAHSHARVQGRVRVLKDQLHVPAHFPHGLRTYILQLGPVKEDLSACRFDRSQYGAACGGFSTAGLANQRECLLLPDLKGNIFHRMHIAGGLSNDTARIGKYVVRCLTSTNTGFMPSPPLHAASSGTYAPAQSQKAAAFPSSSAPYSGHSGHGTSIRRQNCQPWAQPLFEPIIMDGHSGMNF